MHRQPGPLMLDVAGTCLTDEDRQLLQAPEVGGLILFARNFENTEQLCDLTASLRACRPDLIIGVDHEGGRVQRFRSGFTRLPAMGQLGRLFDTDPAAALSLSQDIGWLLASELQACDIDLSFTPVLDLDLGRSSVIGDRGFHAQPDVVSQLAAALMAGMHEAGMPATGKHFPGHGYVEADSHLALPEDERSLAAILAQDMVPFVRLIKAGLDAIMPAHVIYRQVDSRTAGFSPLWLQDWLREHLQFDGVIFSDDLSMEGASVAGGYAGRIQAALAAGCDMLLVCNHRAGALEALAALQAMNLPANPRLQRLCRRGERLDWSILMQNKRWQATRESIQQHFHNPQTH